MSDQTPRRDNNNALNTRTHERTTLPRRRSIWRRFWLPSVLLLALAAGGLTGIVVAYSLNYSQAAEEVKALATYRPSVVTRVYADDGETVIGEFALERRIPLKFDEIPPNVKNSILAVEDARFFEHKGIDPVRIAGAVWKNVTTGSREGGSTLTQQLAKRLFLSPEQSYKRKVNEWVVALQIERYYTKQQIMEMYVNNIFLGAGAYGFEAAAETYFGKHAKDLTVEEAATLAGIPKAPSQLSPTVNPKASKERRDLVLQLMANNNLISQSEAEAARARPITLNDSAFAPSQQHATIFSYPVEEIRQYLEDKYTTRVAQSGLAVYSTINIAAQKKAFEALRAGLRTYDRTHGGWRGEYQNISALTGSNGVPVPITPQTLAAFKHSDWYVNKYEPDSYCIALITNIDAAKNEARARFGNYEATVTTKDMGRSARQPRSELKVGDLAEFKIKEVDENNHRLKVELSQIPAVQGAMMTINAKNGEIVTMIGGYDFSTNKFNNATQAYRQTGSCFKPFVYTAAVEWGMTPDSVLSGAPINKNGWQPHNYDGSTSCADTPMKSALAHSLNIPAVHALEMIGIQTGAQMVRRFGITQPMAPYLPSALGATEVPLVEMVSAYSAFPNKGIRNEKHLIRRVVDRDGNTLEEWEKTTFKVVSQYVALTMVSMMRGVTAPGGTAPQASTVGGQVAGKTGTVNDHTDVWFIGYSPTYVTGVWMGYSERKKSLGSDMTGGHGALPIWVDFMKDYLKDKPKEKFDEAPSMPEDIKELYRQRQREMSEQREAFVAAHGTKDTDGDRALPALLIEPKLEQITLPPAPGESLGDRPPATDAAPKTPVVVTPHEEAAPPPPPTVARPAEQPPKKKGKKGAGEP